MLTTEFQELSASHDALRRWSQDVTFADGRPPGAAGLREFPVTAALELWRSVGKAHVDSATAALVAEAYGRSAMRRRPAEPLDPFIRTLLDVHEGVFSYETYIALQVVAGDVLDSRDPAATARMSFRRITQILVDLLRFEVEALDNGYPSSTFPPTRPEATRRIKGTARTLVHFRRLTGSSPARIRPVARFGVRETAAGWAAALSGRCGAWLERLPAEERERIRLSLVPMSTSHDEVMFIRVLQAVELLFTPLVGRLRQVRDGLQKGCVDRALAAAAPLVPTLRHSIPLFRILTTMAPDRFATFRELTVGASAIQSRQYKLIEALCATPSPARASSDAFRCLSDEPLPAPTIDLLLGDLPDTKLGDRLCASLGAFDEEFRRWKLAHANIARKMIQEAPGTAGTEGVPYLRANVDAGLFPSLPRSYAADQKAR